MFLAQNKYFQKSRFRGVYKCGKRWKAQLQSQGIQFYLGTYDTEEEAAKAYDRKAREEKGGRSQTNYDENGFEVGFMTLSHFQPLESKDNDTLEPKNTCFPQKRHRTDSSSMSHGCGIVAPVSPVRYLWDRLCVISERLLLATAALEKLNQLQSQQPDEEKLSMITALSNEITLLTVVKVQIEEAVAQCFSSQLFGPRAPLLPSISHTKRPAQLDVTTNSIPTDNSSSSSY